MTYDNVRLELMVYFSKDPCATFGDSMLYHSDVEALWDRLECDWDFKVFYG